MSKVRIPDTDQAELLAACVPPAASQISDLRSHALNGCLSDPLPDRLAVAAVLRRGLVGSLQRLNVRKLLGGRPARSSCIMHISASELHRSSTIDHRSSTPRSLDPVRSEEASNNFQHLVVAQKDYRHHHHQSRSTAHANIYGRLNWHLHPFAAVLGVAICFGGAKRNPSESVAHQRAAERSGVATEWNR